MNETLPCQRLPHWDWKSGQNLVDKTLSTEFVRNYFDCGVYFFDGEFNVVKFPKGMYLYHGSGVLANAVVEFPVGINFYKEYQNQDPTQSTIIQDSENLLSVAAMSDESIEEIISKSFDISAGWYADPSTARLYSGQNERLKSVCGDRCINSYKLKKDIVLFLLDDDYNISKLFHSDIIPDKNKFNLAQVFSITTTPGQYQPPFVRTDTNGPFNRIKYNKNRVSERYWDLPLAKFLCENVINKLGYAGYGATSQQTDKGEFHLEFVFCNAFSWLERDLNNVLDWQHNSVQPRDNTVRIFMEQLGLYQSTNVNFHAGDLLQHSIWTLLFTEQLMNQEKIKKPDLSEEDKNFLFKITAFSAFIHDIGKMAPQNPSVLKNNKRNKFLYFSIQDHPTIGYDYINGTEKIPVFDTNLNQTGELDIDELFIGFDIPVFFKPLVSIIVRLHWKFGEILNKLNTDTTQNLTQNKLEKYAFQYFDEVLKHMDGVQTLFEIVIYMLLVVSIADINASQVYGVDRLSDNQTSELNKQSLVYPFITNMPKKYRGGNIVQVSSLNTLGIELGNTCMLLSSSYTNAIV